MTDDFNQGDGTGTSQEDEILRSLSEALGDPKEILNNPFAAISKIMANPALLKQLDGLYSSPAMQKQISDGMNNPLFQQMMRSNPQLDSLFQKAQSMGGNPFSANAGADAVEEEFEEEEMDESDEAIDSVPIDWLSPPHAVTAFVLPTDEGFETFSSLFSNFSTENLESLEILAARRLSFHLGHQLRERLEQIAAQNSVEALDLMVNVAGFLGDFLWAAVETFDVDVSAQIKRALAGVRRRSGFPVASFLIQLLLRLDEFDAIDAADWENVVWALSANPQNKIDGNFSIDWDEARLLVEIAVEQIESDELLIALIFALLQWDLLDISQREKPVQEMLGLCPKARRDELYPLLLLFLNQKRFYSVSLRSAATKLNLDLIQYLITEKGFEEVLSFVVDLDSLGEEIHEFLIRRLDLQWSSLDATLSTQYLKTLIANKSDKLIKLALTTGLAWEPEIYRTLALEHDRESIRAWAKTLDLKA